MHLKQLLLLLLIAASLVATAQRRTTVHGYVLDSINYSPVANAQVTNTNTNRSATTNEKGIFSLSVGINDILFVTATGYHFDTLRYNILLFDNLKPFRKTRVNLRKKTSPTNFCKWASFNEVSAVWAKGGTTAA